MLNVNQSLKRLNTILTPPTKHPISLGKHFSSVWYVIQILLMQPNCYLPPSFNETKSGKNNKKTWCWYFRFMLTEQILTWCWHSVASRKAIHLLYLVILRSEWYRCTATTIEMASKVGAFVHCHFAYCHPGGHWGNTEWILAQWQHPGTSSVALDVLHWVMHSSLPQRFCMTIEMAHVGGTFVASLIIFALA